MYISFPDSNREQLNIHRQLSINLIALLNFHSVSIKNFEHSITSHVLMNDAFEIPLCL